MMKINFSWFNKFSQWMSHSILDQINQQSYIRLSTSFENIKDKEHASTQYIKEQLDSLKNEPDWNTVKSVELLLIPLLNECDLDMELHYQMHKANSLISEQDFEFFKHEFEFIKEQNANIENKRALLSKLTSSLHKFHEDRQLRSIFANKARLKIGILFSLAIVLSVFLLAVGILHPEGIHQYCSLYCPEFSWVVSIPADDMPAPTENREIDKIHLHYVITALMAGCMGACFSMLISLKNRVESITLKELENQHSLHFILTRIITGIGAALICYYFFRAEFLSGSLFPDFSNDEEIRLNSKTFFTMIIWCFIAGFSEKLVPSILSKTAEQIDKKR